jgi:beta-lactamase regulating signal transducer with metallopeptidase domain
VNAADFMLRLARISAEAGVVVLLVLTVQRVFRRQLSPHWRCALWLLLVARLLPLSYPSALSIFNMLPAWSAEGPTDLDRVPIQRTRAAAPISLPAPGDPTSTVSTEVSLASAPEALFAPPAIANVSTARNGFARSPANVLFAVWLGGVLALSTYVAVVSLRLHRRLARLQPTNDPTVTRVLQDCGRQLGVRRVPLVLESADVATPALHGLFRPRLLLPRGFRAVFSEQELRFVFLHELAHLQRRDLLLNWIVAALQIAHWFNPLVWLGFARWRVDREVACDALALAAAGSDMARPYGHTMLRLLENVTARAPQPGLVGILESRRQLQRRMQMIAAYTPARPPLAALAIMAALAVTVLTDAKIGGADVPAAKSFAAVSPVPSPPAPTPATSASATEAATEQQVSTWKFKPGRPLRTVTLEGEFIVFLVRASGSMLGETVDDAAALTRAPGDEKRRAPKWQRTLQMLEQLIAALDPQTQFQIILFNEQVTPLPRVANNRDVRVIAEQQRMLGRVVPQGGANLERAFAAIAEIPRTPSRVILVTDALPTTDNAAAGAVDTTETQRRAFFDAATKQLPPRVPISTILLPLFPEDAANAGSYWQLANATRGELFAPAAGWPVASRASTTDIPARSTHVAFVIDSSGSMRDPNTGALWPIVVRKVEEVLDSHRNLAGIQLLDGDGRFMLDLRVMLENRRRGNGADGWHADSPDLRERIKATLRTYNKDSISNPVPGVTNAMRFLHDKDAPDMRMAIYVFGDEFIPEPQAVLDRLDELNPRGPDGKRRVTINAIAFPTTIRHQYSMGNTGIKFASLMHRVAHEHGGAFIALQDL